MGHWRITHSHTKFRNNSATYSSILLNFGDGTRMCSIRVPSVILDLPEVDFHNFTASGDLYCTSLSNFNTIGVWATELVII